MKLPLLLCTLLATINLHVCERSFIDVVTSADAGELNREYGRKNEEFLKKHSHLYEVIKELERKCNEECIEEGQRFFFPTSYYNYCTVDCRLRKLKAIVEADYYRPKPKRKVKKVRFQLDE
ncbi:hypothetical protein M513_03842 [Trichuris suis]|uniref:Uncharacterized protein n=1 Tax=Trichuris suis TaxID=68888 RepID=A0A085MDA5_9BILA|nr:hypothetical protein M513_03842 [Trichuris suis]